MQEQLLFSGDHNGEWRLDERTKTMGKQGIAAARERLQRCRAQVGLADAA